jgi:hypothetical protein
MLEKIFTWFLGILTFLFPKGEGIYVKEHMIDIEFVPVNICWIDDINVLLSSYGNTFIYNIYNRESNKIDTCESCLYGYDSGFVYCKFEHREIQSIQEFSTTISLFDIQDFLIFRKDIFPTVVPSNCSRKNVLLYPAYSFLEQNNYVIDIEKDSFEESDLEEEEKIFNGIPDNYLILSQRRDSNILIVMDEFNRLWVYTKK